MYLICDSTSSQVLHAQPSRPMVGSGQSVVSVTSDPLLPSTLDNPTAYWWTGAVLAPWPSLSPAMRETTLTVTVDASTPPATWVSPSKATVSLPPAQWSTPITLSQGSGTLSLAVHPSLLTADVLLTVTASGTLSSTVQLGETGGTPVGLQVVPATSSAPAMVAPAGTGSRAFLRAYYLGLTPATQIAVLTEALQNLMITASITNHLLTEKIVPMLQANSYSPLSLSSVEAAAITNWTQNVQPNLVAWADLLDSAGNPIAPYSELQGQAPTVLQALQAYSASVQTLPNLG